MSQAQLIREYLRTHGRASSTDLAKHVGVSANAIAKSLYNMRTNGHIIHVATERTATNVPRYVYELAPIAPKRKPGPKHKRPSAVAPTQSHGINVPPPQSSPLSGLDALLDNMADHMVAALVGRVKTKLALALAAPVPAPQPDAPAPQETAPPTEEPMPSTPELVDVTPIAPAVERGPKLVVVGLTNPYHNRFINEFKGLARLSFWHEGKIAQLRDLCQGADAVFVHLRHVSHAKVQAIKATVPAARIVFVPGGATEMSERITEYLCKE